MEREDFTVYGVQNPREFQGNIKVQDLEALCCQYLEVQPMFKAIKELYQMQQEVPLVQTAKLDVQKIFKIISSASFIERTPRFLNNMYTSQSVKIIEASIIIFLRGLLKMNEIRDAMLIFVLKEMEHQTTGLPLNDEVLSGLLWKINKTISNDILKEWMKRCNEVIEHRGIIQVHEFLYLVCNTVNRHEYIERIPKIQLDRERDKFGIFKIEAAQASTQKNPDEKIQTYMKYLYNMDKMIFDGRSLQKKDEYYTQKRKNKMDQIMKSEDNFQQEFRKMLRDQELYEEIKIRLRNANQLINQAKINGKLISQDENGELNESDYELDSERQQHQQQQQQQQQQFQSGDEIDENKNNFNPNNAKAKKLTKLELVQQSATYQMKSMQRPQSAFITTVKQEVNLHRQMVKEQNFLLAEEQKAKNANRNSKQQVPSQASLRIIQKNRPQTAILSSAALANPGMKTSSQGISRLQLNTSPNFFGSSPPSRLPATAVNAKNNSRLPSAVTRPFSSATTMATSRPISTSMGRTQSFSQFHKRMLLSSAKTAKSRDSLHLETIPGGTQTLDNLEDELEFWEERQHANKSKESKNFVPFGNINKKNYTINVPWSQN